MYYLITKRETKFEASLVNLKLQYYRGVFDSRSFFEDVARKRDYYIRELKPLVFEELPRFEEVEKTLKSWIKNG